MECRILDAVVGIGFNMWSVPTDTEALGTRRDEGVDKGGDNEKALTPLALKQTTWKQYKAAPTRKNRAMPGTRLHPAILPVLYNATFAGCGCNNVLWLFLLLECTVWSLLWSRVPSISVVPCPCPFPFRVE